MTQKYYLCHGSRILLGPVEYNLEKLAEALKHHGGSVADLPANAPDAAIDVLYLKLLPEVDKTDSPAQPQLYHVGQPARTVLADAVEVTHPLTPYPLDYCSQLISTDIAQQADDALGLLEAGYTEREVKSWSQQQAEAAAWAADNNAVVPLLQGLADRRGIALVEVVAKVQAKVQIAAQLTGVILGDAQAANDQLDQLKQLQANDKLPDDWFNQLQTIAATWRKDWPKQLTS